MHSLSPGSCYWSHDVSRKPRQLMQVNHLLNHFILLSALSDIVISGKTHLTSLGVLSMCHVKDKRPYPIASRQGCTKDQCCGPFSLQYTPPPQVQLSTHMTSHITAMQTILNYTCHSCQTTSWCSDIFTWMKEHHLQLNLSISLSISLSITIST